MMKLFVIRLTMRMLSWVTPRAAEYIAPTLAAMLWHLSARRRGVTRLNLQAVFPDMDAEQREKIGRSSMTHYIRGVFEAGMLWNWPLEKVFDCFDEANNLELLEGAGEDGRGVIVAVPHCGAWELVNLFMLRFAKGAILYKPGKHADINEMLLEKRSRSGAKMVPATAAGIRTMFKLLKSGHSVGLLPDQVPTRGEGHFAPFFGVESLTGVLLPRMARRTHVPVVFAVCERRKGGRYCVHLFKADEAIYSEDMRVALTAVNRGIEQCIEVDAGQYLWAYKRFKHRPEGKKSIYNG